MFRFPGMMIVALLWAVGAAVWAPAHAGPKMDIDRPERNLGTVIAGTLIEQDFTVHNTGDAELIIRKVDND